MIQPYNILFHKGNDFVGRIVKFLTKGEYSHCALVLNDSYHLLQLNWKTKTSIQHLNYKQEDYDVYYLTFTLTDDEKEKLNEYILERLSTTYDYKFIGSRFFNAIFGTKLKNSNDKYNCDEIIVDAFRHIGVNLLNGDEVLSPSSLSKSKVLKLKVN